MTEYEDSTELDTPKPDEAGEYTDEVSFFFDGLQPIPTLHFLAFRLHGWRRRHVQIGQFDQSLHIMVLSCSAFDSQQTCSHLRSCKLCSLLDQHHTTFNFGNCRSDGRSDWNSGLSFFGLIFMEFEI